MAKFGRAGGMEIVGWWKGRMWMGQGRGEDDVRGLSKADDFTASRHGPSRRRAGGLKLRASWPIRMSRRTKLAVHPRNENNEKA
jgi:hypothetical protein